METKVPYTVHRSCLATMRNNERLRNMKLLQLISDNFTADDYYITFHYSKNQRCGSEAAAKMIFNKYLRKLRTLCRTQNVPFSYVRTTRTGKRGRITHYMILNSDVSKEAITQLWKYSAIPPVIKPFGFCDNTELLNAFTVSENEIFKKAYTGSRNLCRNI